MHAVKMDLIYRMSGFCITITIKTMNLDFIFMNKIEVKCHLNNHSEINLKLSLWHSLTLQNKEKVVLNIMVQMT